MRNGLHPGGRRGIACGSVDASRFVWLTDDPSYIFETQCGDAWIRRNDPVVLSVYCDGVAVASVVSFNRGWGSPHLHEFIVAGHVDAGRLSQAPLTSKSGRGG